MVRYSAVNWISTISYQLPMFAMPVIVLVNVRAQANASFYVAWAVVGLACYVPTAIGQALLTEGGRDGAHLRAQVRLALVAATGLMVAGAVVATVARGLVPALYGASYQQAADVLPLLVAAADPVGHHVDLPHRRRGSGTAPPTPSPSPWPCRRRRSCPPSSWCRSTAWGARPCPSCSATSWLPSSR